MLEDIPKLLLNYRILNKLTQVDMAIRLRCNQPQYSLWETGKTPPSKLRREQILELVTK